jgi:hypothetical protein
VRNQIAGVIVLADEFDVRAEIRQDGRATWVDFHVPSGHVPPSARAGVVAAVFDLPQVHLGHVKMSLPLGDAELLDQLRRRCRRFASRAAGSTCLVDAEFDVTIG